MYLILASAVNITIAAADNGNHGVCDVCVVFTIADLGKMPHLGQLHTNSFFENFQI